MSDTGTSGALMLSGEDTGSQSQVAIFLELFTQLVAVAQTVVPPAASPYIVTPWVTAGDLVISTAFPTLTTGTISVRQGTPGALNVTLPGAGGPWIILDGAGVAASDHITILPPGGFTINGGASFVINANWGGAICILDGTNYIVISL